MTTLPVFSTGIQIEQEGYEFLWKLENMHLIQERAETFNAQDVSFEFGESQVFKTKWNLALRISEQNKPTIVLKLLNRSTSKLVLAQWTVGHSIAGELGGYVNSTEREFEKQVINDANQEWTHGLRWSVLTTPSSWVNTLHRSNNVFWLKVKIVLEVTNQETEDSKLSLRKFTTRFVNSLQRDFSSLYESDSNTSDVTIVCSDMTELRAHKPILSARNEVFASMFGSDMQESKTGLVHVKDVSSKIMKILLEYFYTGNLNQCWSDPEIVYEFIYAVSKYQIGEILEMLDENLGTPELQGICSMKLFKLVNKLLLKNAEKRMMRQLTEMSSQAKDGNEFLALLDSN